MTHTIRQYKESDLNGVLSSWENASKVAHSFLSQSFLDQERYNIPNVYLPNTDTWVADIDGRTVGFIALMGGEVGAIFVEPEFHGCGIGFALMNKARALNNCLEVEVFKANAIGRKFYSNYGFRPLLEKLHAETGEQIIRLQFSDLQASKV